MVSWWVRTWREWFGGQRGILLNLRDDTADLRGNVFSMIEAQRSLLRVVRQCNESAALWRKCHGLALQTVHEEIIVIASLQADLHEATAHRTAQAVERHVEAVERCSELAKRGVEAFVARRLEFKILGVDVSGIELPDPEAQLAEVSKRQDVEWDSSFLPIEQAQQFIRQLQPLATA